MSATTDPDCGSSSCIFSTTGGMRTNGPCRCYENAGFHGSAVMAAKQMLREVLMLRAKVDAEQHIRQLAPAKPWDDAREFQRLAGEVAAIDRKDPVAFIRELHHMILSARKVAFWSDERAYALKLELEAAPKEVPPKWIKVTDRLPHVGQLVVGRAQLGKNRVRRILLTYYPDPKAPTDPPWMADDFALYSLTDVPMWAPIPSEEA